MEGQPVVTWAVHDWLRKIRVAYEPGPADPILDQFIDDLLDSFRRMGHAVLDDPSEGPDVLLTTAIFGQPLNWREAPLFTCRRRYKLDHAPMVYSILHATPKQMDEIMAHFTRALQKEPPDPQDFIFDGMAPNAFPTLYEQGRRGGPILSVVRLVQSQSKAIRNLLVIGDDHPVEAYSFDLVGAHPRTSASLGQAFYDDLALRIVTALSTYEITDHQVVGEPISHEEWLSLQAPGAMIRAGKELGKRGFFTEMVRINNLVKVPAVEESVSSQYSEGCYATWEPKLDALVATITGSARPVNKENLSEDELAVIAGVRPDGKGALIRMVEGKRNDPPSSEAVELIKMDSTLPKVQPGKEWPGHYAPVARSKLHGHRGVRAFDPKQVEYAMLDEPFFYYPVSCSTEAQARAIQTAFGRSQALADPDDPHQLVFTLLPGHGLVIIEKWVAGKEPFQVICEAMDSGAIEVDSQVPQGPFHYEITAGGKMEIRPGF